jgi:uncharacterized protein (DUF2384 family)
MALHARAVEPQDLAEGPTQVDPALADAGERRRLSGPAMRTFLAIADRWRLSEEQRLRLLGLPGRSTFYAWAEKGRRRERLSLNLDILLRISAVLGIHKALRIVFPREQDAIAWLSAPNQGPLFGGQRPIDLITCGTQDGLLAVRRYLDAWRGGYFAAPNAADRGTPPLRDEDIVLA